MILDLSLSLVDYFSAEDIRESVKTPRVVAISNDQVFLKKNICFLALSLMVFLIVHSEFLSFSQGTQ